MQGMCGKISFYRNYNFGVASLGLILNSCFFISWIISYLECNQCAASYFFIFVAVIVSAIFVLIVSFSSGDLVNVFFSDREVLINDELLSCQCEVHVFEDEMGAFRKTTVYKAYMLDKATGKYVFLLQAPVAIFGERLVLNRFNSKLRKIFDVAKFAVVYMGKKV